MRFSSTENVSSEQESPRRGGRPRWQAWDLNPPLFARFLAELGLKRDRLRLHPDSLSASSADPADGPLIVAASRPDEVSGEILARARQREDLRCFLLLPACDLRLWRRLTRLGWEDALSPPFQAPDLTLILNPRRPSPLIARRLPALERRVQTTLCCSLPADPRYVAPAADLAARVAREHGYPPSVWAERLPLVLDEALCNAIDHGCGGDASRDIRLSMEIAEAGIEIRVTDPGSGFDPARIEALQDESALLAPGGRGLLLMRAFSDELSFEDGGRSALLRLSRRDDARAGDGSEED